MMFVFSVWNIKPSNLFLSEVGHVILGEFGLLDAHNSMKKGTTVLHKAPEAFIKRELVSDVWSFGITIYDLSEGENHFGNVKSCKVKDVNCDNDPPSLSSEKWSSHFMSKCLMNEANLQWICELTEIDLRWIWRVNEIDFMWGMWVCMVSGIFVSSHEVGQAKRIGSLMPIETTTSMESVEAGSL